MTEMSVSSRPVALVTGGGGDIGRAIARRLALTSEAVAIVDIDEASASETANLVRSAGCKAMTIRADVSNATEVAAIAAGVFAALSSAASGAGNNATVSGSAGSAEKAASNWKNASRTEALR